MPIKTDSEEWKNGSYFDWTAVHVRQLLSTDEAYTLDEIADELLDKDPSIVPQSIREEPSLFRAHLFRVLERQSRRNLIEDRIVTTSEGNTNVFYTNSDESGVFPLAKIIDDYPQQFSSIEEDIDEQDSELSDLENRVQRLEYQFREEHRR